MNVDCSQWRHVEESLRQDHPVRRYHEGIHVGPAQQGCRVVRLQIHRLLDRNAVFDGELLDRTRRNAQAPAERPVRLRKDNCYVVGAPVQRRERLSGELWRTGEC